MRACVSCLVTAAIIWFKKRGIRRRAGRGGEAPEGQAHAHGPGPGVKQKQEIAEAKMKALQHTGVPSSSSSTSSSAKAPKAKGKQTSQSKQAKASSEEHHSAELAMSQAAATESTSAAAAAVESSSPSSSSAAAVAALESASSASELALVLEAALGTAPQDVQMNPQLEEGKRVSSQSWAEITAQDEEEDQKSKIDQNTGVQIGDQELAWSRVLEMTDEDLRKDTSQEKYYRSGVSIHKKDVGKITTGSGCRLQTWNV